MRDHAGESAPRPIAARQPGGDKEPMRVALLLSALWVVSAACGEPADEGVKPIVADGAANDVLLTGDALDDGAGSCPGAAGCPCLTAVDCAGAPCLFNATGSVCAGPCDGGCAQGFICSKATPGGYCVPELGHFCDPCVASAQCQMPGHAGARCVIHGAAGAFCGIACAADGDCPAGNACKNLELIDGGSSKQCAPTGQGDTAGICACSNRAKALKLKTICDASGDVGEAGDCPGLRGCTTAGLSACAMASALTEVCDGIDNDCDGQSDELACDDANECTNDVCVAATGACKNAPTTTLNCDADGSPCTAGDACKEGVCGAGPAKDCDDANPCTDDVCFANVGCVHPPNTAPCDADGSACSVDDACKDGVCLPGAITDCDDGNPCTVDGCDANGDCVNPPKGGPCDADGSSCTQDDACQGGECVPGPPLDCDDGNPCTQDSCEAPLGDCLFAALPMEATACNADGSICTQNDTCKAGKCVAGVATNCDDGNTCTLDACNAVDGCTNPPVGGLCDADGSICTKWDVCKSGACTAGPAANCNDGNDCTLDTCDPNNGDCSHNIEVLEGSECDADGSVCTVGDACKTGKCVPGKETSCDDNHPCTDDLCSPLSGCQHADNSDACDADGNPCTVGDACKSGGCLPGKPKSCDDGSICTDDSCVKASGDCLHLAGNNGGKACNADNSTCTVGDKCVAGKCIAGPGKVCSDGNVCTQDDCNPSGGCVFPHNTAPCDADGSLCTTNDACKAGKCVPGDKLACSDNKICTDDLCEAKIGCKFVFNKAPCDADGNGCTVGDACKSGKCAVGLTKSCSDGNNCTVDSCNAKNGECVFVGGPADGKACDDGNACTVADKCSGGKCVGGGASDCNDGNVCTKDSCAGSGCKHVPVADWIACGSTAVCLSGACKSPGVLKTVTFGGAVKVQTWTVPANIKSLHRVQAWGAGGGGGGNDFHGSAKGGAGGRAFADQVVVKPGQLLLVVAGTGGAGGVGCQTNAGAGAGGWPGGGHGGHAGKKGCSGGGGGGGGYSGVFVGTPSTTTALLVAGGGGGGGGGGYKYPQVLCCGGLGGSGGGRPFANGGGGASRGDADGGGGGGGGSGWSSGHGGPLHKNKDSGGYSGGGAKSYVKAGLVGYGTVGGGAGGGAAAGPNGPWAGGHGGHGKVVIQYYGFE